MYDVLWNLFVKTGDIRYYNLWKELNKEVKQMKIESLEGIVLSETNYSESSKILNVLTPQGLIGVMSKGCRNVKSKLRGVSAKLVYGTFHIYYRENGLSTLISVDVINSFSNIMTDLEKISYAAFLLDLVYQVAKDNNDSSIYFILRDTLEKINAGLDPMALTNILELKMLNYLGVSPALDSCSKCGNNKNIVTLSSHSGGYICGDCYSDEGLVSEKTIKMIRLYYYVDIKNISKLDVSSVVTKEINQFLDDYYDRYTGIYLKSKAFVKRVAQLTKDQFLCYNMGHSRRDTVFKCEAKAKLILDIGALLLMICSMIVFSYIVLFVRGEYVLVWLIIDIYTIYNIGFLINKINYYFKRKKIKKSNNIKLTYLKKESILDL